MYQFESETPPPFAEIPEKHQSLRGQTHYDWSSKKMTEIYLDRCIDIFPSGNDFSCQFISDQDHTYLLKFKLRDLSQMISCCRWSESAFWAPRPDVLHNMKFQKNGVLAGQKVRWWSYDIPLPGPFGYATRVGSDEPAAFWFPVIHGWVQQNFSHYRAALPNPKVFEIPQACLESHQICESSESPK